MKDPDAFDN